MKKFLFLGIGSALMFTMSGVGPAQADNGPHVSGALGLGANQAVTADRCAGCHRIHTAKSNDGMLLKTTNQQALCFSCHGPAASGAATNVVDGVGYETGTSQDRDRSAPPGALRSGGFNYALINSAQPTKTVYQNGTRLSGKDQVIPTLALTEKQPTTSNHSLDTPATAWGNGAVGSGIGKTVTLECGSCHDPHGNRNYRILKPIPAEANNVVTAAIKVGDIVNGVPATVAVPAVMSIPTGVVIPDALAKVYTTTNYWLAGDRNVPAVAGAGAPTELVPDGFIANVSDWCTTCHTRYNAPSGSRSNALVDAAGVEDPIFTYRHTSTERTKVVGNKNCVTCHVAHGSNASANGTESSRVPQPDGNPAQHVAGAAGSRLLRVDNRGICVMCHNL